MPLSTSADRELLHLRDIDLRGYQRADGLVDIEAHLVDTKTYTFPNVDRGEVKPGEPLHGMWLRLTINLDLEIIEAEAASDFTPYVQCPQAAPNFSRLAGLKIGPGFNKAVNERVGGVVGCTHLREVLAQMATVAYQTTYSLRDKRARAQRAAAIEANGGKELPREPAKRPSLIGTCLAYDPAGEVVRKRWPEWSEPAKVEG
jgi:hypothetical protein